MTCRRKTPARQRGSFTYYFFVFHSSLTRGRFGEAISNSEEVQAPASRKRRASINTVDFKPKVWYNYKKSNAARENRQGFSFATAYVKPAARITRSRQIKRRICQTV